MKSRLHAVFMIGVVVRASVALAQDEAQSRFALDWNVPEGCLDRSSARDAIDRALGTSAAARAATTVVRVSIAEASNAHWNADIWMYDANGSGERSVDGTSCEQVAQATTLIVALALADAPALDATDTRGAKQQNVTPVSDGLRYGAGGRVISDLGSMPGPGPDLGLALLLMVQHRSLRAEVEASAWWPRAAYDTSVANGGGRFYLVTGGLRGCLDVLHAALSFGPCVGAELGATFADNFGLEMQRNRAVFWGAGLLGLSARYLAAGPLWVGILGELGVPFHRPAWQVDDVSTPVFRPSVVIGRVSLSLGWLIP